MLPDTLLLDIPTTVPTRILSSISVLGLLLLIGCIYPEDWPRKIGRTEIPIPTKEQKPKVFFTGMAVFAVSLSVIYYLHTPPSEVAVMPPEGIDKELLETQLNALTQEEDDKLTAEILSYFDRDAVVFRKYDDKPGSFSMDLPVFLNRLKRFKGKQLKLLDCKDTDPATNKLKSILVQIN